MYDIIGDVHGHATLLKKLLKTLGYVKSIHGYNHPDRKAVFVGDFLNRGPEIRQTISLIRSMVDSGAAYAVLGNHEINNILYYLKDEKHIPLLKKRGKRYFSVTETIQEFAAYPDEWKEYRRWMRRLPLFLELDGIRVAHAYWSNHKIELIRAMVPPGKISRSVFRNLILEPASPLTQAILQTTRGVHLVLPKDLRVFDNRGRAHRFFRIKWWELPAGQTFGAFSYESKFDLPAYTIPPEVYPEYELYSPDDPPMFFGHYCRGEGPQIVGDNLCCVDSCVTVSRSLAAYRWNGERILNPDNILVVKG